MCFLVCFSRKCEGSWSSKKKNLRESVASSGGCCDILTMKCQIWNVRGTYLENLKISIQRCCLKSSSDFYINLQTLQDSEKSNTIYHPNFDICIWKLHISIHIFKTSINFNGKYFNHFVTSYCFSHILFTFVCLLIILEFFTFSSLLSFSDEGQLFVPTYMFLNILPFSLKIYKVLIWVLIMTYD